MDLVEQDPPQQSGGAGTCDMCRADPEKARQCQELAKAAQLGMSGTATRLLPAPKKSEGTMDRISCSEFVTKLGSNKRSKLDHFVFERLHAYPYSNTGSPTSHHPAMELDAREAAQALAELSSVTVVHKPGF